MTMVSTGPISLGGSATSGGLNQSVNIELGRSATASINMNESAVRTLAGVSSGAISMSNFYGKANVFAFTISSNQTNANLRTLALNAGWNGTSAVVATVASGVYVYSTSTGIPGLTIDGSWPGGVTLVNTGFILGMGGDAPTSRNNSPNYVFAGNAGGPAISLGVSVAITNNSYIAGGGGSGGSCFANGAGGGGAGGGKGADHINAGYASTTGGAGGGPGASGASGNYAGQGFDPKTGQEYYFALGGGGGGRVVPGSGGGGAAGPFQTGAGGGAGGGASSNGGASGGGAGNPGSFGTTGYGQITPGGGGGWGASGGQAYVGQGFAQGPYIAAGGAGGRCVQLNGYTVTWNVNGTRYGAIS